jgi:hypothetical protein
MKQKKIIDYYFGGTFDGNNKTISGLIIKEKVLYHLLLIVVYLDVCKELQ